MREGEVHWDIPNTVRKYICRIETVKSGEVEEIIKGKPVSLKHSSHHLLVCSSHGMGYLFDIIS